MEVVSQRASLKQRPVLQKTKELAFASGIGFLFSSGLRFVISSFSTRISLNKSSGKPCHQGNGV
eukprot:2908506-Amphidinium_carterae.1